MSAKKQTNISKLINKNIYELKDAVYNPNKISALKFEGLKQSLLSFGAVQPAVVNINKKRYNTIIGGHQRIKAASELKWQAYPCIEVDLDEDSEKELNIRLNVTGEFDFDVLKEFFKSEDLIKYGFDPDSVDFEIPDMLDSETEDVIPEPPEEPQCKLGDIWYLGKHKLLCGDCTVQSDVSQLMTTYTGEMLFTSPPYSDQRDYSSETNLDISNIVKFIKCFREKVNCQVVNLGIQRKNNEINTYWNQYIEIAKKSNLKFLSWNVWNRESQKSIGQQTAMFPIEHEFIFVFGRDRKKNNRTVKNKTAGDKNNHSSVRQKNGTIKKQKDSVIRNKRCLGTVQTIQPEMANNIDTTHPAKFPVKLPEEYIKAMTKENNIVVDPFLGSGTTIIACEKTQRVCYGIEIDPSFCDIIIKRWEGYTGKTAMKAYINE